MVMQWWLSNLGLKIIEKIKKPISQELKIFDKQFNNSVSSKVRLLDLILIYILNRKGKQIRPILVLLFAKMYSNGKISEKSYRAEVTLGIQTDTDDLCIFQKSHPAPKVHFLTLFIADLWVWAVEKSINQYFFDSITFPTIWYPYFPMICTLIDFECMHGCHWF